MQHSFSVKDQQFFGQLSGDVNPIHVDELAARRSLFGEPVVHGIHLVFWSLEQWIQELPRRLSLKRLEAVFNNPVPLNTPVDLEIIRQEKDSAILALRAQNRICTRVKLEWIDSTKIFSSDIIDDFPPCEDIEELDLLFISEVRGFIDLFLPRQAFVKRFPHLSRSISPILLSILLASTRLVGMRCPGQNSLYSELSLQIDPSKLSGGQLHYQVCHFDDRFNLTTMDISSPGITGQLKAFIRPLPRQQATYADLANRFAIDEFASQRALVVGGSRGLGEVTAKLLAGGGAKVLLTYHRGKDEAEAVAREIRQGSGQADCIALDVLDPNLGNGDNHLFDFFPISHLYYFATPPIKAAAPGSFEAAHYDRFCAFYIHGLSNLIRLCLQPKQKLHIFYPSSTFVDELPSIFIAYITAKKSSETLLACFNRAHARLSVHCPRLPPMATDQTLSLTHSSIIDPADVMHTALREAFVTPSVS